MNGTKTRTSAKQSKSAIAKVGNSGFWSRRSELEDDLREEGFDILESNSEYIVVDDLCSESDTQYVINLHGTESSIVFSDEDIRTERMPDDDDDDEDDDEWQLRIEKCKSVNEG